MSKDIAKVKEEMKAEFARLKDEMKQEMKVFKDSVERELRNDLREIKNEHKAITQSLEFAHASIKELQQQLKKEQEKNVALNNENKALQKSYHDLEGKTEGLESRVVQSEQYSRNKNIEIRGVVECENENTFAVVAKIGEAIKEPITKLDVECCHRVPVRNSDNGNIIVQLKSREKRNAILQKAKKARLTNDALELQNSEPIYVNEHLCPALKKLLGMTVSRKREYAWKSAWTFNGKIFAKKTDDSRMIQINNERDLEKIC